MEAVLTDGTASFSGYGRNMIENVIVAFAPGIKLKDLTNNCRFLRIDDISAVMNIIAQRRNTAQKLAFLCFYRNAVHAFLSRVQYFDLPHSNGQ